MFSILRGAGKVGGLQDMREEGKCFWRWGEVLRRGTDLVLSAANLRAS